jgi:outer membrane biosynthesis protein TonB
MKTIERSKIAKELEAFCDKYDTYSAAAKALGITLAQLSTARNDESTVIPAKALAKLGYGYALVYVRKADMPAKRPSKKAAKKPAAKKPAPKPKSKPKTAAKPKAKAPAKKAAKKPAKKKADKPAPVAVSTPAPKPAPKPRPAAKPTVTAPPVQRDVPAAPQPEKVVTVTSNNDGAFN